MNQAAFHIRTKQDGILRLEQAILIYRGASNDALATIHDIKNVSGEPTILAGQAMTPGAAIKLACSLSSSVSYGGFLPDTVLYMDGDLLMWWVRPAKRHIVFRAPELGAPERGEVVPHPGLIFAASSKVWKVWAVKGNRRPTLKTRLYQAPYFNVYSDGGICQGNVQKPSGTATEKIDAWNAAFFGTFFTHTNANGQLLRYDNGAHAFWRDMLDGKFSKFPTEVLINKKTTLSKLLGAGADNE